MSGKPKGEKDRIMAPVVIAKDLYKCYAGFAPVLRGVNLEVQPGEMVAIMGPSGCGKSTMLHILGLLHAPDAGSLEILGTNALTLTREQTAAFRRGNIGFVMQSSNLFEHSTVFENVEFPLIYENVPPQERWARVIRALDLVRLSARVHYPGNRLSGGEQQRVAIARAMVNNPRILMADEPTGALDARTSRLIMENFRTLCHSGGVSMIMVTHDPKMAEYCDTVYTLEEGVLVTRKHNIPAIAAKDNIDFLKPPEPVVRGALVAAKFPEAGGYGLLELARRLNELRLLSRIYAISQHGFPGGQEGYSLPLPVRRIGLWQALTAFRIFFQRARGSDSLWGLWRGLPRGSGLLNRIRVFARGFYMAHWGLEDKLQFFYAASAGNEATAAWVAARLLRLPFIFFVGNGDLSKFDKDRVIKARDAALIVCPTKAAINRLHLDIPELPLTKILLVRPSLPALPPEEEQETAILPGQRILPLAILWPDAGASRKDREAVLGACAILKKKNVNFRLHIAGPKSFGRKWKIFMSGLRGQIQLLGSVPADQLGEIYKTADIFVGTIRDDPLLLPDYVTEAMAFGLGIAACSPTAGMLEALEENVNALFAPAGDAAALASVLEKLANPELRHKLGGAAKKKIAALLDVQESSRLLTDRIVESAALGERRNFPDKDPPGV